MLFVSCNPNRPQGQEKFLLPGTGQSWWMLGYYSGFEQDSAFRSEHFLFTVQDQSDSRTGQVYVNARLAEPGNDGVTTYHVAFNHVALSPPARFPLKVLYTTEGSPNEVSEGGELPSAGFSLSRKGFSFRISGETDIRRTIHFQKNLKFPVRFLTADSAMVTVDPDIQEPEVGEVLSLAIFRHNDGMVQLAMDGAVAWIDLVMQDGNRLQSLIYADTGYTWKVAASFSSHSLENGGKVQVTPSGLPYISGRNGKTMQLDFRLDEANSPPVWIRPLNPEMDIPVRGGSLWLGPVTVFDSGGISVGAGSMCMLML